MAYWAIVFLVVTLPFCIFAAWSDLKFLKIPNIVPVSMVTHFHRGRRLCAALYRI